MQKTKIAPLCLTACAAFMLGAYVNSAALSDDINTNGIKIGVVDVAKVVNNSSQVKSLKAEQETKKEELQKWLNIVKADIDKQATPENKLKMQKKYQDELNKKQESNKTAYVKKLEAIDKNITKVIADTSKAAGYNIVFSKNAVLFGGNDLTDTISKAVK